MLLTSITLCCFVLNVQSQFLYKVNPDQLYFSDNKPQFSPTSTSPAVTIEKSDELAYGSIFDQETNANVNFVNRRPPVSTIGTTQQADTRSEHVAPTTLLPLTSNYNSLLYSVTNFGIKLLKNINAVQPGNVVVSPFSITTLLALLQQGAIGQTKVQITNVLQMTSETSASSFDKITGEFKNRNSRNILETANSLFIADAFSINPDFQKVALKSFNSDVTPLSFARPELAAQQINSWVASKTNNQIEQLIAPDSLGETTQAVLVNAVYFKGLWDIPFRVEATMAREFQLSNGRKKTAQFMRMRQSFRTGTDSYTLAKVLILPFELNQYSLMIILPAKIAGITNTLSSLTDARLLSYLTFPNLDTEIEIPKFTARADTDLTPIFRNMGITDIFGQYAELSGVGTYRNHSPQISSAVHSAVLSIDEKGGTAAAATAFGAVALSYDEPTVVFKANRPFIAVLWDVKNSLPIFMAIIEDPQQ